MANKQVICKVILQVLVFSCLFGSFVYFFMKDQMETFMKGRTTITRRVETVNSLEFPTITICFDPATKLSVAKKYGFKNYVQKFFSDVPNKTLPQVFDEITYGFEQDYSIWNHDGKKIHLGLNDIDAAYSSVKMQFQVDAIKTWDFGTCIKMEPRFEMVSPLYRLELSLQLSSTINTEDKIESVLFIFTSNRSWVSISNSDWPQYQPLKARVHLSKEFTQLFWQAEEEYFKHGTDRPGDCLKKLVEQQNCSVSCWGSTIPGLPYCQTASEYSCVDPVWGTEEYFDCFMTKEVTHYSLIDRIETPYHEDKNKMKTDVLIGIKAMQKVTTEEVFVLTLQDLIGSVGGSLGLFFGFSFSAVFFACLNKLFQ